MSQHDLCQFFFHMQQQMENEKAKVRIIISNFSGLCFLGQESAYVRPANGDPPEI